MTVLIPSTAVAQVVVTEIMYDLSSGSDSGREWIELYNMGTMPVTLPTWKIFENSTNHKIVAVSGGETLASASYAVIADNPGKFKTDWPHYAGQLYESAFSLGNDSETIVLLNASSTDIDVVSYQSVWGASGDGNSLNRLVGQANFVPRSPSPGSALSATALSPLPKVSPAKVAPKAKTTATKKVSKPAVVESADVSEVVSSDVIWDTDATTTHVAAASSAPNGSFVWWLGAITIAALAGGALFVAQRFRKSEWDIEEMGETR